MKLVKLENGAPPREMPLEQNEDGLLETREQGRENTRFLVVDDDVNVRDLVEKELRAKGWDDESIESYFGH